ncbi:hypothetical protein JCM8547_007572 [Rhodosporidiobolus lusitaniae]
MTSGSVYPCTVHLAPLDFPLSSLSVLSSLQLALVPFHLDNDEPDFPSTLSRARNEWTSRRTTATQSGYPLEGEPPFPLPPPSSSSSHSSLPSKSPSIPSLFVPLIETLRVVHSSGKKTPLRAHVGSELRARFPDVFRRDPRFDSFKLYVAEAKRRGFVGLEGGQGVAGRDTIWLKEPYASGSVPHDMTPPSPPKPPLPSPLPPSLFHLADLSFPFSPSSLSSLPSHQLLLIQYKEGIPAAGTEERKQLEQAIEDEFWRRREEASARGEEWKEPKQAGYELPTPARVKREETLLPPSRLPPAHYLTDEHMKPYYPAPPSSYPTYPPPPPAYYPPLPTLLPPLPSRSTPLPPALAFTLHTLDISFLPPHTISSPHSLISRIPSHLAPTAVIIYAPTQPSPLDPPSRRAHVAFRSRGLAGAAEGCFNALRLEEGRAVYPVHAVSVAEGGGRMPVWEWGDVREEERGEMWREWCEGEAKRERGRAYEVGEKRGREGYEVKHEEEEVKKRRVEEPQLVYPSTRVPLSLLRPFFATLFTFLVTPPAAHKLPELDDCFVHRFGALGWRDEPSLSPAHHTTNKKGIAFVILFGRRRDAEDFERWVKELACRYWKMNGTRSEALPPMEVKRLEWIWRDFSPAFRAREGVQFAKSEHEEKSVGRLGVGRNVEEDAKVGWFAWEYKYAGLPYPRSAMTAAAGALAARLGGKEDAEKRPGERRMNHSSRAASLAPSVLSSSAASSAAVDSIADTSISSLSSRLPHTARLADSSSTTLPSASSPPPPRHPPPTSAPLPSAGVSSASHHSPSLSLSLSQSSGPNRRMTASDLNEFDAGLEQLFEGAEGLIGTAVPPSNAGTGSVRGDFSTGDSAGRNSPIRGEFRRGDVEMKEEKDVPSAVVSAPAEPVLSSAVIKEEAHAAPASSAVSSTALPPNAFPSSLHSLVEPQTEPDERMKDVSSEPFPSSATISSQSFVPPQAGPAEPSQPEQGFKPADSASEAQAVSEPALSPVPCLPSPAVSGDFDAKQAAIATASSALSSANTSFPPSSTSASARTDGNSLPQAESLAPPSSLLTATTSSSARSVCPAVSTSSTTNTTAPSARPPPTAPRTMTALTSSILTSHSGALPPGLPPKPAFTAALPLGAELGTTKLGGVGPRLGESVQGVKVGEGRGFAGAGGEVEREREGLRRWEGEWRARNGHGGQGGQGQEGWGR